MKLVLCLLIAFGYSVALPSPLQPLAWEDIKGENVYIEPISNYTVDAAIGGRIVGGTEVTPHSIPYQVAIFINGVKFCGGSLISQNFVLTAAHCTISASFVQLIFGAHSPQSSESTQVRTTSTNIINHPDFIPSNGKNDVSLIRTPSPISIDNNIQIINLAPSDAGTYVGSVALLTGWGKISDSNNAVSKVLRGVNLNVISNEACTNSFGSNIQESNICTSGTGAVGGCSGDSGGPLVVDSIQVGVASFVSSRGCEFGLPTAYARVSSFRNWIEQNSDISL